MSINKTITDQDRADWVQNSDILAIALRKSRKSLAQFIAQNRKTIDYQIMSAIRG